MQATYLSACRKLSPTCAGQTLALEATTRSRIQLPIGSDLLVVQASWIGIESTRTSLTQSPSATAHPRPLRRVASVPNWSSVATLTRTRPTEEHSGFDGRELPNNVAAPVRLLLRISVLEIAFRVIVADTARI